MKKWNAFVLLLALGACLSLGGCAALPLEFDVETKASTTVQKGTLLEQVLNQFGFDAFTSFDISQSKEFENNNAQKKHVVRARLTRLTLTITSPEGQTFDFLDRLTFYVEAPGLPRKEVASKKVPRGVRSFDCERTDLELAPYVKAEQFSLTTSVTGKRPNKDTTIEAKAIFHIAASL